MARLVLELGQHRAQGVERVVYGAAINARVQILARTGHLHLDVGHAPQGVDDGRRVFAQDVRVRDHGHVGGQPSGVLPDKGGQVRAADLLLALDDALEVDRRGAGRPLKGLDRLDVDVGLALVVRGAPGEQVIAGHRRLKGRRLPLLQRVGWLDIIVAVDQDRRRLRAGRQPLGHDHRMSRGGDHLGLLKAGGLQFGAQPVCSALHVGLVRGLGADAGYAQELLQFGEGLLPVALCVVQCVHVSPRLAGFWDPGAAARRIIAQERGSDQQRPYARCKLLPLPGGKCRYRSVAAARLE